MISGLTANGHTLTRNISKITSNGDITVDGYVAESNDALGDVELNIAEGAVVTEKIANSAVTTAKINNRAITAEKTAAYTTMKADGTSNASDEVWVFYCGDASHNI